MLLACLAVASLNAFIMCLSEFIICVCEAIKGQSSKKRKYSFAAVNYMGLWGSYNNKQ